MLRDIRVSCAPHISQALSTRRVMIDVIIGLVPAMAAAGYYFRIHALILIGTCVISCVVTEWVCNLILKRPNSLGDFSAVVTGIILALSLPPGLPVWAAVIGSAFSIAIGKMVFGGLGSNIFNPAMVGRTFLTACFGMLMTTWMVPATIDSTMPKIAPENMMHAKTQATPLGWSKIAIKDKNGAKLFNEEQFKFSMTQYFIFEVKFYTNLPAWLKSILCRYDLKRKTLSKYIICINSHKEPQFFSRGVCSGILPPKQILFEKAESQNVK